MNHDDAGAGDGRHIRRKRYRGSHPRHFSEKYKEHRAEEYPEDIERILARGATPAGSHRPVCVDEILSCLAPMPGETAVDATLGHGGHALALLSALAPGGRLYGFDRDAAELSRSAALIRTELRRREKDATGEGTNFIPVCASFAELAMVLAEADVGGVDLVLADLGLSSMQIDDPERGFSFKRKGPLDMRMDRDHGPSAAEWLASVGEEALAKAIRDNADESRAVAIAREICLRRGHLATTRDLAEAVCLAFPELSFDHPGMRKILARIFQAIRIEVNGEFQALETLLSIIPSCLNPGGRVAILSFHSGEDRRVEAAFAAGQASGFYSAISAEATGPGDDERKANPRSSSARLRWARAAGVRGTVPYSGIHR